MPSSKRSSSKRSSSNSSTHLLIVNNKNYSTIFTFFAIIFGIAFNGTILYYLYNLEDETCQCIRDWRHNFIKVICTVSILTSIVALFGLNLYQLYPQILPIWSILGFIEVYAVYTYVGDLNSTQCSCAIQKQPNTNAFMKGYVSVIYFMLIFMAILVVIAILLDVKNKFID